MNKHIGEEITIHSYIKENDGISGIIIQVIKHDKFCDTFCKHYIARTKKMPTKLIIVYLNSGADKFKECYGTF